MEATGAGETTPKRKPKALSAKPKRVRKARSKKPTSEAPPSLTEILQTLIQNRSRGQKATYLAGALGLAAAAATKRGRRILGRAGSFALPIAVSVLQPRIEAIVRATIEKKLGQKEN